MKIQIEMDEKWPVFTIFVPERKPDHWAGQNEIVDIPDDLAAKFLKIQEEYQSMQTQLEDFYDRVQANRDAEDLEAAAHSIRHYMPKDSGRIHGSSQHPESLSAS